MPVGHFFGARVYDPRHVCPHERQRASPHRSYAPACCGSQTRAPALLRPHPRLITPDEFRLAMRDAITAFRSRAKRLKRLLVGRALAFLVMSNKILFGPLGHSPGNYRYCDRTGLSKPAEPRERHGLKLCASRSANRELEHFNAL
jgi:hypothetical protein